MKQTGLKGSVRRWLCGMAIGVLATAAQAQGLSWDQGIKQDAPDRYTVVKGDTLWDISGRFLQHPWQWPEVWDVNPQIRNPHLIYPGDIVYLYDCNGQPCLGLERGQGVVKLSPEVRTLTHREAIGPVPLEAVEAFLGKHRILTDPDSLAELAYVVAGEDGRLISGSGDRFYARGDVGQYRRYGIYRLGERYLDPVTQEVLGLELQSIGEARIVRQDNDIAVMRAVSSEREISSDDIILPLEDPGFVFEFMPDAPEGVIEGTILAVKDGIRFLGPLSVVTLNKGMRDGIDPGHVLAVERRGHLATDPRTGETLRMPGEDSGLVMVFRSFDKMSYGLVMSASHILEVGDRLHNPRSMMDTAQR